MEWTRFKPKVGDLIILEYHRGRRVGILVKRRYKAYDYKNIGIEIVWTVMWAPIENKKLPSRELSELTILNYLKAGKARLYRSEDEI